MKSSNGEHCIALDHLRAVAAFMVFTWHFIHGATGLVGPVQHEFVPTIAPFALLDEGHAGVALFMVLSGYLFATLLMGRTISLGGFYYNRALRLLPLLSIVIVLAALVLKYRWGGDTAEYWRGVLTGPALPTLANGGWSITVEAHFYLLLPMLLALLARNPWHIAGLVCVAIAIRIAFLSDYMFAYHTMLGRFDQFAAGMLAATLAVRIRGRHIVAIVAGFALSIAYWMLDRQGGVLDAMTGPVNPAWMLLPTLEGVCFGVIVAWYATSFRHSRGKVSRAVAACGAASYSMYLLHPFVVFDLAKFARWSLPGATDFYIAILWSALAFAALTPIAWLSYRYIELPFLKLRRPYVDVRLEAVQPA